jgi:cytochrome c oxidase subunit 1
MSTATTTHDEHHDHGPDSGLLRWVFTTNHKDIGTLYMLFALAMLFVGGGMAMIIRLELLQPGLQFVDPHFFNQMTTVHALAMIFGAVMPAAVGFANWQIPLMIGAPDMALPRLNNWSFWILPFAFTMLLMTLFFDGGGPAGGWTLYPPLVLQTGDALPFVIFAIHLLGISSIMGSINIIVTIFNMRAPGMTLLKMPLFVWTWLITAFLLIAAMPVLAGAVTMLLTDHFFSTSFFNAAGGGDPVMFQHIFWFFGHPEVYIIILPAFGIVSQIIPTFSRKPLFGYESMVYATASIAFISFVVWAHHMFTVGMPLSGELFFMYTTMLIAVPTGVKVFNWVATMWRGAGADAVGHRVRGAVHDRRLLGSHARHHPGGLPVSRHLLRGRALPLCAGNRGTVRPHRRRLLLAAQVDRPHVRREARQVALLVVHDLGERAVLPDAFPRARGYAAPDPGLCGAVHRVERRREHRRFRLRNLAAGVSVYRRQDDPGR